MPRIFADIAMAREEAVYAHTGYSIRINNIHGRTLAVDRVLSVLYIVGQCAMTYRNDRQLSDKDEAVA